MKSKDIFLFSLIGLLTGIISGFFGSGGGMILVIIFSHFLKLDEVESRASTIFCITFMVITSSFFYMNQNFINFEVGEKCAIGGIIGGFIGSKLLIKLKSKYLELLFVIFLVYSGIKMIL